jgi:hypothetical protein
MKAKALTAWGPAKLVEVATRVSGGRSSLRSSALRVDPPD